MTGEYEIDSNEFDHVIEMILAVFFMFIGAVGISVFVSTLYARVDLEPRVDKVQVTRADYYGENYPFKYTGFQAYMFAWMMDGSTDDSLAWIGNPKTVMYSPSSPPTWVGTADNGAFIRLEVTESPAAFRVARNRAIIGVEEYTNSNVRNTIKSMAHTRHNNRFDYDTIDTECLYAFYNPAAFTDANGRCSSGHQVNNFVILSFTAGEKCAVGTEHQLGKADEHSAHISEASIKHHVASMDTDEVNTWRYKYEWILHPCSN